VPIRFIFDSALKEGLVNREQPNDGVLTLRSTIDAGCGEELDSLLDAVSVDEHDNIAF
jgi:hypothetical protein